jgi:hypothetical protein
MSDNYVRVFKLSTLYKQYLQGSPLGHGPHRNEFLFKRARGFNDPIRLAVAMANYTFKPSFINRPSDLKIEKVFGSAKRPIDYPLDANNDSHSRGDVNFSHP